MAKIAFIQFHGADNETVEGAASVYHDGKELGPGLWSVSRTDSDTDEIMNIVDMPDHWQEQLKRWNVFAEKLQS